MIRNTFFYLVTLPYVFFLPHALFSEELIEATEDVLGEDGNPPLFRPLAGIGIYGGYNLLLGVQQETQTDPFHIGAEGRFYLPFLSTLSVGLSTDVRVGDPNANTVKTSEGYRILWLVGMVARGDLPLFTRIGGSFLGLGLYASVKGGYYLESTTITFPEVISATVQGAYTAALGGISMSIYDNFTFDVGSGLYLLFDNGGTSQFNWQLAIEGTVSYIIDRPLPDITILTIEVEEMFAPLYPYYRSHSVGRVVLKNDTGSEVSDAFVSIDIKGFMDIPSETNHVSSFRDGQSRTFMLKALFDPKRIMRLTESREFNAVVTAHYTFEGQDLSVKRVVPVQLFHRNSLRWDDDRKVSSFINFATDPELQSWATRISSLAMQRSSVLVQRKLHAAIAVFAALQKVGIGYVNDPQAPVIGSTGGLDFVRFPRQLVSDRGGDCDDLTVVFCSLLAALGIKTAFVTVPGHIFMMFGTGVSESQYQIVSPDEKLVVMRDGKVWIPLETTMISDSFQEAWVEGAQIYSRFFPERASEMSVIETDYSQGVYPGVPFDEGAFPDIFSSPRTLELVEEMTEKYKVYIHRALTKDVYARIADTPNDPQYYFYLAGIHKVYGYMGEAEKVYKNLQRIAPELSGTSYGLGLVRQMEGDSEGAIEHYRDAIDLNAEHAHAYLGLSLISRARGEVETANTMYNEAIKLRPSLKEGISAAAFSSLDPHDLVNVDRGLVHSQILFNSPYDNIYGQFGLMAGGSSSDMAGTALDSAALLPDIYIEDAYEAVNFGYDSYLPSPKTTTYLGEFRPGHAPLIRAPNKGAKTPPKFH